MPHLIQVEQISKRLNLISVDNFSRISDIIFSIKHLFIISDRYIY